METVAHTEPEAPVDAAPPAEAGNAMRELPPQREEPQYRAGDWVLKETFLEKLLPKEYEFQLDKKGIHGRISRKHRSPRPSTISPELWNFFIK